MSTPNNEGTPTPRTDALWNDYHNGETGLLFVEIKTKQMEHELSLEKEDKARILKSAQNAHEKKSEVERSLTATKQRLEACEKALHIIVDAITEYDAETVGDRATVEMHAKDVEQLRAALHPSADKAESNEGNK